MGILSELIAFHMEMETWQWGLAILGALLVGLGKGGLSGIGNLTVMIFAMVFAAKASVGILLPVLISADIVAVYWYRKHVQWKPLRLYMPWMAIGILVGFFTLDHLTNQSMQVVIGAIILLMTALHFLRQWHHKRRQLPSAELANSITFAGGTGIVGGFATMVANAAGPISAIYLLALRLPKLEFIATMAWCFFIANIIKIPFSVGAGLISPESLAISFPLMPVAMLGAMMAPHIVKFIPQKLFEIITWSFVIIGGIKLILS